MPRRRIRLRPPGLQPGTRIGPLGPFRGRLGVAWVVAPLILGLVLIVSVWLLLLRHPAPGGTFRPVGPESSFAEGTARMVGIDGVFVGRTDGQLFAVAADPGCSIRTSGSGYVDCRGARYGLDGEGAGGELDLLPLTTYRGSVYVDPGNRVLRGGPG